MTKNTEIAHLIVEGMTASAEEAFLKWLIKRAPVKPMETSDLTDAALWWLVKLKSGDVLPGKGWPSMLPINDLVEDYINAIKNDFTKRGNSTAMGRFLKDVGAVQKKKSSRKSLSKDGTRRPRHYTLHGLDACRAAFEAIYGAQEWPDSEDSVGSADDAQKGDSQYPDGE